MVVVAVRRTSQSLVMERRQQRWLSTSVIVYTVVIRCTIINPLAAIILWMVALLFGVH